MNYAELERGVREELAQITETNADDWFLVFKARYGMEVVFRSIATVRGAGEILTSYYTCPVTIGPMLVAGMKPVYQPTSRDNLFIGDVKVRKKTRAVMLQHTFGVMQKAERLDGAVLVEDSALCLGKMARDEDGEVLADVSIHSFGVEKLLRSTRFGGAVYVNPEMKDVAVRDEMRRALAELPVVGGRVSGAARMFRQQVRALRLLPVGAARKVRKMMTDVKVFEPVIAAVEQAGGLPYVPMKPAKWMLAKMLAGLKTVKGEYGRREKIARYYLKSLSGDEDIYIPLAVGESVGSLTSFLIFLATPELARDVRAMLAEAGIYTGRWYAEDTLFGAVSPEKFGFSREDNGFQESADFVAKIICLPTGVTMEQAELAVKIVKKNS
jgi:dTDP-4-amino-4,6-dideoxygalactose transaminase